MNIEEYKKEFGMLSRKEMIFSATNMFNLSMQKTELINKMDEEIKQLKELVAFTETTAAAGLLPSNLNKLLPEGK